VADHRGAVERSRRLVDKALLQYERAVRYAGKVYRFHKEIGRNEVQLDTLDGESCIIIPRSETGFKGRSHDAAVAADAHFVGRGRKQRLDLGDAPAAAAGRMRGRKNGHC
jgi:hypothetical protein